MYDNVPFTASVLFIAKSYHAMWKLGSLVRLPHNVRVVLQKKRKGVTDYRGAPSRGVRCQYPSAPQGAEREAKTPRDQSASCLGICLCGWQVSCLRLAYCSCLVLSSRHFFSSVVRRADVFRADVFLTSQKHRKNFNRCIGIEMGLGLDQCWI